VFCFHSHKRNYNRFNPHSNSTTNEQTPKILMKDQFKTLTQPKVSQIAEISQLRRQCSIQIIAAWYKRKNTKGTKHIAVSQSRSIQTIKKYESHSLKTSCSNFSIFPISLGMLPDNELPPIFCNNEN